MPRLSFIPREEKFVGLFSRSADNAAKAAGMLQELVNNCTDVKEKLDRITEVESAGDAIAHEIFAQMHRSFITPFDREDIGYLARSLDDVTDTIEGIACAMCLYKVNQPSHWAVELADNIVRCVNEVRVAISYLSQPKNFMHILEKCVEVNRLENEGDQLFRSAIAELFDNPQDMAHVIKWREIYELMESTTDRCEDISNVLEGIVLKHA